jgi:hypothetical protein
MLVKNIETLHLYMKIQAGLDKRQDLISKITRAKRARGEAKVVQLLTSKHKALNSNPATAKTKQKNISERKVNLSNAWEKW